MRYGIDDDERGVSLGDAPNATPMNTTTTSTTTTTKPTTKVNPLHAQQDKVMTLLAFVSRKSSKHLGAALARAKAERK